jgi:hypothetical protein
MRLSKMSADGKTGTVVPLHDELKPGTLRGALRLAKVDIDEFFRYIWGKIPHQSPLKPVGWPVSF